MIPKKSPVCPACKKEVYFDWKRLLPSLFNRGVQRCLWCDAPLVLSSRWLTMHVIGMLAVVGTNLYSVYAGLLVTVSVITLLARSADKGLSLVRQGRGI